LLVQLVEFDEKALKGRPVEPDLVDQLVFLTSAISVDVVVADGMALGGTDLTRTC
jgi:hypothetical protein